MVSGSVIRKSKLMATSTAFITVLRMKKRILRAFVYARSCSSDIELVISSSAVVVAEITARNLKFISAWTRLQADIRVESAVPAHAVSSQITYISIVTFIFDNLQARIVPVLQFSPDTDFPTIVKYSFEGDNRVLSKVSHNLISAPGTPADAQYSSYSDGAVNEESGVLIPSLELGGKKISIGVVMFSNSRECFSRAKCTSFPAQALA